MRRTLEAVVGTARNIKLRLQSRLATSLTAAISEIARYYWRLEALHWIYEEVVDVHRPWLSLRIQHPLQIFQKGFYCYRHRDEG